MYRNISIMLFVLFVVVVCLAASKGGKPVVSRCWLALHGRGNIYCQINGYDNYDGLTHGTCKLGCGGSEVQLPKEACPRGRLHNPCTEEELKKLKRWADGLEDKREKIKGKLCSA
uniref:Putative ixodes 10 kDa peptide protein n=1 Tax=Ixodes ricinus TaxID=34613 RepID=A0A0K8RC28_IXORI